MLTKTSKLLGTDGRKMSKSYGNAIYLSDSRDEVKQKLSTMFTDPQRLRRTDPGTLMYVPSLPCINCILP